MITRILTLSCIALATPHTGVALETLDPCPFATDEVFRLEELSDGVWAAVVRANPPTYAFANALVVVGKRKVLVVDTHASTAAARTLICEIERRTDRPVAYVVNTHWHGDHLKGNAAYARVFEDVEIIAHISTAHDVKTKTAEAVRREIEDLPASIEDRRRWLETGRGLDGKALRESDRERIAQSLRLRTRHLEELRTLDLVPPNRTFQDSLTIDLGDRRVRLLHIGPAHTAGDVVVWLPEEHILAAGDVLEDAFPYFGEDSEVDRVREGIGEGRSLEDIQEVIDLEAYRAFFTGGDSTLDLTFERGVETAVARAHMAIGTGSPGAGAKARGTCSAPGYREFDFWIGKWDIRQRILQTDGTWKEFDATTHVEPVLGGCALFERWSGTVQFFWEGMTGPARLEGMSFRSYDPEIGEWAIWWIDERNPTIGDPNRGVFEDGIGSFYRDGVTAQGDPMTARIRFFDIEDGFFRWDLAISTDGRSTWTTIWEMDQTRRE